MNLWICQNSLIWTASENLNQTIPMYSGYIFVCVCFDGPFSISYYKDFAAVYF